MASAPKRKIPPADRQFSLLLALVSTHRGLTKTDIFETVRGYRPDDRGDGRSDDALAKQFERDKADLRELGITIETVDDPEHPEDNRFTRYRVSEDANVLPAGVTFSPEETLVLQIAADVWRRATLSAETGRAIMKLKSRGVETSEAFIGIAPRLRQSEAAYQPLMSAVDAGRAVRFDYLNPGRDVPLERHVEPLALLNVRGNWLLAAFDLERNARRNFLLSRIVSPVRLAGKSKTDRFAGVDIRQETIEVLAALESAQRARIAVRPGTDAEVVYSQRGTPDGTIEIDGVEWSVANVGYSDLELLADELSGFGPEAAVISPHKLRELVRERFERILHAHGAQTVEGEA